MPTDLKDNDLSLYDYTLPQSLIAQEPVYPRDASRLFVLHRSSGTWEHRSFQDLPSYLNEQDLMVANNTRVMQARLLGHRLRQEPSGNWVRGGKVEFLLLEACQKMNQSADVATVWEGLFHASTRAVPGIVFEIAAKTGGVPLRGTVKRGAADSSTGTVLVEFDRSPLQTGVGQIPLPHYMKRMSHEKDDETYQTIYAKQLGSAAAPTAGLHFTEGVLEKLRQQQVAWEEVTLHVGLGTFRPVQAPEIHKHPMHEEKYEIAQTTAEKITQWKQAKQRVLAVGTTSVRALESAWQQNAENARRGALMAGVGRTSLFIHPGSDFKFQVVDRLLTNFHLPKSTLLMLVAAFAGREFVLAAYQEAMREHYRFFSYGDAMLILE